MRDLLIEFKELGMLSLITKHTMSDTLCNNLLLYAVSRYEPAEGSRVDEEEEK